MKPTIYNKSDFSKGQKVYLLICKGSNAARYIKDKDNVEDWILEATVSSVGKKYIMVDLYNYSNIKFDMTNNWWQHTTYGSIDYLLFKTKQEVLDVQETEILYRKVKENFSGCECPFTLNQMKSICDIIGCK